MDAAYKVFPHIPKGALERPSLETGLLIGQDHVELLACGGQDENQVGGLRVMNTMFGSGFVLGGWHDDIKGITPQLTEEAKQITSMRFAKTYINGKVIAKDVLDVPDAAPRNRNTIGKNNSSWSYCVVPSNMMKSMRS